MARNTTVKSPKQEVKQSPVVEEIKLEEPVIEKKEKEVKVASPEPKKSDYSLEQLNPNETSKWVIKFKNTKILLKSSKEKCIQVLRNKFRQDMF